MVEELRSPAVPRAIAVLEEIAQRGPSAISDIADRRGLPRSSASDVCAALEAEHLVSRDWQSRVVLGRTLSQVASGLTAGLPVIEAFGVTVERVSRLIGLTVSLDTLYCGEALCVSVRHGRQSIPLTPRPGRRMRLDASATGRALLRGVTPDELSAHFADFASFLPPEGLDLEAALALRTQADSDRVQVGRSGYGYEFAAAVRTADRLVGAVTLTVPADAAEHPASHSDLMTAVRTLASTLETAADVTAESRVSTQNSS